MSGFAGIICPVCGRPFAEGDDIVVCPDCGTPHHRACYNRLGRCINAEKHADGFIWQSEAAQTTPESAETAVCARCGAANSSDATHCALCGYPLRVASQEANAANGAQKADGQRSPTFSEYVNEQKQQISRRLGMDDPTRPLTEDVSIGDMADFVGPNNLGFLVKFRSLLERGGLSFNLGAFFFSGLYCFYRKMYKVGAAAIAVVAAVYAYALYYYVPYFIDYMSTGVMATSGELYETVLFAANLMRIVSLTVSLALGLFFNRLYLGHCVKGIKDVKQSAQYSTGCTGGYRFCLARKGGVDRVGVVVLIAVLFALYMAAVYVLMSGHMPA